MASTNKDAVLSVVISARTAADETSLLRQVAQGLSINQASLEAILTKVAQLAITGQDVYLMVDDAEQLQDSALEVLLLLASGTNEGRLHVFLFGEPSLLPRLEVFSEGEERFHAIELQPYSEETRDYLAQRLEGAGQGIELISNDLLVDIHEQSEGWPGAINQVARDALIEAMLANRGAARKATGGSFNLPKKHLVILAVVAIGVIAAWFMQGKSKPEAPQTASTELSMNGATPAQAQAQQPGSGPAVEFNGSSQPLPLPLVGESQPVIREPLAQAAGQGGDDEGGLPSAAVPPTVSSSAPPVTPLANNGVTPMHPVPPAPTEPTAPTATPTPAQTPAPAAPVASAPASKPAPAPLRPSRRRASRPPPPRRSRPPAAKPASGGGAGSQWYRNQSGGNFVLQILGTGSEANAQAFIRQQGGGDFRYFKKTLQGKFYVVTYGSFPNRAAALAAVKNCRPRCRPASRGRVPSPASSRRSARRIDPTCRRLLTKLASR